MEKRINYEEESGFTWHKSWNIPSIEVKISRRDLNAIKTQLGINRVYCEITSGYPIRKMVEFFIQEVTLEGETRKEIGANGVARFSNLKFLPIYVDSRKEARKKMPINNFLADLIPIDQFKEDLEVRHQDKKSVKVKPKVVRSKSGG